MSRMEIARRWAVEFVERVRREAGDRLLMAVLFGSAARGEGSEGGDVDVLLVHSGREGPFREAASRAWARTVEESGEPIEVHLLNVHDRRFETLLWREAMRGEVLFAVREEEMRRREAEELLLLAREFLAYAEGALGRGEVRPAIDEGYNAAELAVKGMVVLAGEDIARTHGGLISQFGRLYVKTGKVPPEVGAELGRAHQLRAAARYRYSATLSIEDARAVVSLARRLVELLERALPP